MFNLGITFLTFLMFKSVIMLIETKKQTITLLILIKGVKTIKPTIKIDDPIIQFMKDLTSKFSAFKMLPVKLQRVIGKTHTADSCNKIPEN